jgi:hypothetical protein
LATVAPAAAATKAEAVEMLKVWAESPPVPTMSTKCGLCGVSTRVAQLAHHLRGGGDLADGLLLDAQAGEDGGGHQRRDLAAHDLPHQVQHLVVEDLAVLDGALQGFLWGDHASLLQKILQQAWPCSVRMDSGWNCTPSTAKARLWRTPMISPSSVQAVISRQAGSVSRSMASEW